MHIKENKKDNISWVPVGQYISVEPIVFDVGDCYAVTWVTEKKGTGYITYEFEGRKYKIWDTKGGIIRSDETIHVVKVKKNHLDNNTYSVHSQYVLMNFGYDAIKGEGGASSRQIYFRGYKNQKEINVLCFSDIHGLNEEAYKTAAHFKEKPDIVFLIGDITGSIVKKIEFTDEVLSPAAQLSRGECPVIYTRGNHETRGEFASQVLQYFPTTTGEFYFTTKYGPISILVLDTGEDKLDNHVEYNGLVDFESYREQEFEWLCNLDKDESADTKYRITLAHMQDIDNLFGKDWTVPIVNNWGANLMISGHTHDVDVWELDNGLTVFTDGGKSKIPEAVFCGAWLKFEDGKIHCKVIDINGKIHLEQMLIK